MRALVWFRKDLRLDDHTALAEAVRDASGDVVPFYNSDPAVLGRDDIAPARVRFVLDALAELSALVAARGARLALAHGDPAHTVVAAAKAAKADAVYWNELYEPAWRISDERVERALREAGVKVRRFEDRLLVPPDGVRTAAGDPYTVYSPFRRACETLPIASPRAAPSRLAPHALPERAIATLAQLGFEEPASERWPAGERAARARLDAFVDERLVRYADERDAPAKPSVSRLSADLAFGTIGIRRVAHAALAAGASGTASRVSIDRFIAQLRWRDFYAHVLHHFPHAERGAFRRDYDAIEWRGSDAWFQAWCAGRTGYPIVDAGMRELKASGYMHNRVRMIVASFLTKDLLISWRRGERHFMRHLVDGDLANNNGGWQWAAGCGTDAAPYFRIFNPVLQSRRFDSDAAYVKRWVPELGALPAKLVHAPWETPPLELAAAGVVLGEHYPPPIVDHHAQREACLAMYSVVKRPTATA